MRKLLAMLTTLVFALCACGTGTISSPPAVNDVSGVYVVEEGYQSFFRENQDEDKTEFTREDNIELPVLQSGNAVSFFICLGTLDNASVICGGKDEIGIDGCQHHSGSLLFSESGADVDIRFDFKDSFFGEGYSVIRLKMTKVRDLCDYDSGGG